MRRLLVDLLFMSGGKGGMETYVRELYSRIQDFLPGVELIGVASQDYVEAQNTDWFPGEIVVVSASSRSRVQLAFAEAFCLTRVAVERNIELIHSPANFSSWSRRVPTLLTLHDALSFSRPELVSAMHGRIIRALIAKSARSAQRIITVSEASAREIQEFLGIQRNRISVVPLASSGVYSTAEGVIRQPDFILTVGNNLPHKNFSLLLAAISMIPAEKRPQVKFVGGNGDTLKREIRNLRLDQWVEHLGWVGANDLEALYARAAAVVLPTQFEGFGLPVLEAMKRGCPVICSDIPVLREVAGNAAKYFEVNSAAAISNAIQELFATPGELQLLCEQGLKRSKEFSWRRTAQQTAGEIKALLNIC